jgi:hypothetical protein
MSAVVARDASPAGQNVVDEMARDVRNILNPAGGLQIRGQNNQQVTISTLPTAMVATQGMWDHMIQ